MRRYSQRRSVWPIGKPEITNSHSNLPSHLLGSIVRRNSVIRDHENVSQVFGHAAKNIQGTKKIESVRKSFVCRCISPAETIAESQAER
jgi:hypothetical protein